MRSDVEREVEIFEEALKLAPEERRDYLETACRDDSVMRDRLQRLIEVHLGTVSETEGRLEWSDDFQIAADDLAGHELGGFRIGKVLGEGGMGVVYEAEQLRPARKVALKVIKPALAATELTARFEREVELLGRLQHPGIAQIFEVGTLETRSGSRPFFAMELIEGKSLTRHIEDHVASTAEKLELLAKIADAVDHAHRRNVLHRDLKPQNVLVDESGQPKVLDFGIARLTDDVGAFDETMWTRTGQIVGTLPYMSPEQVRDRSTNLDSRADVWALGVIGYEVLSGVLPIPVERVSVPQAARMILEDDPARLSRFNRTYRGDVETIIAKALEKDRDRRYASAAEMAADLRAHLDNVPIQARPTSTWYQLRKFAVRNPGLVAGVVLAFLSLSIGLILAVISAREAEAANRTTEEALGQAREQAEIAEEIVAFLTKDLLATADPYATGGEKLTIEGAVARATMSVENRIDGNAMVEAAIRQALGFIHLGLGAYPEAEHQLRRALELAPNDEVVLPYDSFEVRARLAVALNEQRRPDESIAIMKAAIEDVVGLDGVPASEIAGGYIVLGSAYQAASRYEEAEQAYESAMARLTTDSRSDSISSLNAREYLLGLRRIEGSTAASVDESRAIYEERVRLQGPRHPMSLRSRTNLARAYLEVGRFADALAIGEELEKELRGVYDEHHPAIGTVLRQRSDALCALGRYRDALEPLARAMEIIRRSGNREGEIRGITRLQSIYRRLGRREEAAANAEQGYRLALEHYGKRHMTTVLCATNKGLYMKDVASRLEFLAEFESIAREVGPESEATTRLLNDMGMNHMFRGEHESALRYLTDAVKATRAHHGSMHPVTARRLENLSHVLRHLDRGAEARTTLEEVLKVREGTLPPKHPDVAAARYNLGSLERDLGEFDRALVLMQTALESVQRSFGDVHPHVAHMAGGLVPVLIELEKFEELVRVAGLALENAKARGDRRAEANAHGNSGMALRRLGHLEDAEEALLEQWEILSRVDAGSPPHGLAARQLGSLLVDLGEHDEAIEYLLEAERILGPWKQRSAEEARELRESLARSYAAIGDEEAARAWRLRARKKDS